MVKLQLLSSILQYSINSFTCRSRVSSVMIDLHQIPFPRNLNLTPIQRRCSTMLLDKYRISEQNRFPLPCLFIYCQCSQSSSSLLTLVCVPVLQDKDHCPFHLKTGACRFGQRCSRVHFYPDKSCTILIKNMYNGPGLAWEQDEGLEVCSLYPQLLFNIFHNYYFLLPTFHFICTKLV